MRTLTSFYRLSAATAMTLALHASATAQTRPAEAPVEIQVTVDVPPSWQPFLDDDVAEAFAFRLQDTFRREGFAGRIAQVRLPDEPRPGVPAVAIRLTEWRIDRTGQARCTFTASLRTPLGEKSLGLFTDTAIFWPVAGGRWSINRRFEAANALEDAAERALRDLYDRVAATDLIPGLKRRG